MNKETRRTGRRVGRRPVLRGMALGGAGLALTLALGCGERARPAPPSAGTAPHETTVYGRTAVRP